MFSSRQIFDVLVTEDQLKQCLDFAIGISEGTELFTRADGPVSLAFAQPWPDVYAIGRGSMKEPSWCDPVPAGRGWTDFQFDFDTEILSRVIWQWAMKQDYGPAPDTDGSTEKGLRAMSIVSASEHGLLPPYWEVADKWSTFETILVFVPAWHRYDK